MLADGMEVSCRLLTGAGLVYAPSMVYRFGAFELDLAKVELREAGQSRRLEPQVFALLAFLIEHRERLVSRDEILEKVWEGRIVSDAALASRIRSARRVLGDDGRSQRYIRTIHGQGFRFVADARIDQAQAGLVSVTTTSSELLRSDASKEPSARPIDRPSLAVLPFQFSGDPGPFATIAEGLPHELIGQLARLRWLFVISRASSFRLRGANLDLREVGRLLGVRYCLTGTVEVSDRRLELVTELADTRNGVVAWAESYTGSVDDIHTLRAEICARILSALEIRIPMYEAADARLTVTENLDAWSAYHLGLQHVYRFNRKDNRRAAELFEQAVRQDPEFARAFAGLSFVHFQNAFLHQSDDVVTEIVRARQYSERGLEIDPLDPFVNFTMGRSYWLEGDLERALSWLERSTSLSPNYAQGIYARAWTETMAGDSFPAREHVDLAMRLSPLDPLLYAMLATRALTYLAHGDETEAVKWIERAARSPGAHALIAMIAAATRFTVGDAPEARYWADDVRRRSPQLNREDFFRAFPLREEAMRSRLANALGELGF